jgi:M6 family metalloprotease-like protein
MRKIVSITLLLISFYPVLGQNSRSNCPVKEEIFNRRNPDGSSLTLSVSGNEMVQYFETLDGFTILERKDGFYEYAILDSFNNLIGSGQIAKDNQPFLGKTLTPHLRYSPQQMETISSIFYQINPENQKKAGGKPFPSTGRRKVLALLIQYPDLAATLPKSNFDSMMVKPNYNGTGSFRDYYLKTSFNQLELNVDVYGWYMAESGFMTYGKSNANYISNVGKLVKRAVLAADLDGVDFSKYDNDSDGYVDGVIIMHAGIGAEEQSAPLANNNIWSHRYNLSNTGNSVVLDGVVVDSYGIFPEKRYNGGAISQVGIGVLTHEFGHIIDLPDLYSTNSNGEGAGNFANMAGGPWLNSEKTPCMHDAWSRIQMNWVEPIIIGSNGTYTIPKSLVDSNFVFKINTSRPNEYFLLENRQKKDFDKYLPAKGLAIWHINSNKAKPLSASSSNSVNTDTSAYGLALKQADGRNDLEKGNNRGDGGDLFPGNTNNRSLDSYTNPNTLLQYKVGGVKQPSNLIINNITQNPDSSITFTIGSDPKAGFDALPSKGCTPLPVNFNNVSAFASSYLWKFHDGSTSTEENPFKLYDSAGSFPVTLYVLDSSNTIMDSNNQIILVEPSPISEFTVTRGDSNTFQFTNNSKNALYVVWRFGSNQSSTQANPAYTISGNEDVPYMLIAYSQNLCTDTAFGIMSFWPLGITSNSNLEKVTTYPNPFDKELNLNFQLKSPDQINLYILNLLGEVVWKNENIHGTSGENLFEIPIENLSKGMYLLQIRGADFNKILRVSRK